MRSDDQHLLRVFAPANFSHHIRGFHRPVRKRVLHVEARSHFFAALNVPFKLPLILGGHRQDRDDKISVETENPRVRKVHPRSLRSRLASDHRDRSCFAGRLQEISEDGKQGIYIFL